MNRIWAPPLSLPSIIQPHQWIITSAAAGAVIKCSRCVSATLAEHAGQSGAPICGTQPKYCRARVNWPRLSRGEEVDPGEVQAGPRPLLSWPRFTRAPAHTHTKVTPHTHTKVTAHTHTRSQCTRTPRSQRARTPRSQRTRTPGHSAHAHQVTAHTHTRSQRTRTPRSQHTRTHTHTHTHTPPPPPPPGSQRPKMGLTHALVLFLSHSGDQPILLLSIPPTSCHFFAQISPDFGQLFFPLTLCPESCPRHLAPFSTSLSRSFPMWPDPLLFCPSHHPSPSLSTPLLHPSHHHFLPQPQLVHPSCTAPQLHPPHSRPSTSHTAHPTAPCPPFTPPRPASPLPLHPSH